jgi:hypothetical protein
VDFELVKVHEQEYPLMFQVARDYLLIRREAAEQS